MDLARKLQGRSVLTFSFRFCTISNGVTSDNRDWKFLSYRISPHFCSSPCSFEAANSWGKVWLMTQNSYKKDTKNDEQPGWAAPSTSLQGRVINGCCPGGCRVGMGVPHVAIRAHEPGTLPWTQDHVVPCAVLPVGEEQQHRLVIAKWEEEPSFVLPSLGMTPRCSCRAQRTLRSASVGVVSLDHLKLEKLDTHNRWWAAVAH